MIDFDRFTHATLLFFYWTTIQRFPKFGQTTNVRFGSLAVVHDHTTRMAASGRKPAIQRVFFRCPKLNVRFHLKRPLRSVNIEQN
jgi:hypothetical protein